MITSGWLVGGLLEGFLSVGCEVDLVAAGAQGDGQRAADLRLVVDHQDPAHWVPADPLGRSGLRWHVAGATAW